LEDQLSRALNRRRKMFVSQPKFGHSNGLCIHQRLMNF
jgi:hypothetical protein